MGRGGEYLRMRGNAPMAGDALNVGCSNAGGGQRHAAGSIDVASLGLLGNKAAHVQLSPLKKKRDRAAMAQEPRKKTRFVTESGIKEAGRESLGAPGTKAQQPDDDDDDDDLDIV